MCTLGEAGEGEKDGEDSWRGGGEKSYKWVQSFMPEAEGATLGLLTLKGQFRIEEIFTI